MKKIHFEIEIRAPREQVWDAIVDEKKYRIWTSPFHEGSYFEGEWKAGEKMRFIGLNDEGMTEGMISQIAEIRHPEYISIRHLGMIMNGVEDTESESVKQWAPSYENYTFSRASTGTKFIVDMEAMDQFVDMFYDMWPKALGMLKKLCEEFITVETIVSTNFEKIWECWTKPEHIVKWNFASDDWETTAATNDLRVGGAFSAHMAAKDGSMGFDFSGKYKYINPQKAIHYTMDDGREAHVFFDIEENRMKITEMFQMEKENSREMQKNGWQAILENFKKYVEGRVF